MALGSRKRFKFMSFCPSLRGWITNVQCVPQPAKEGEGKEEEQRAAEALRLDASGGIP